MTRLFPPWALRTSAVLFACALVVLCWPGPAHGRPARLSNDPPILDAWIINASQTNPHWAGIPVYVQSVQQIQMGGVPYAQVHTNSIADYHTTMTADLIQQLNSRPRAATDSYNGGA
jgi:hypothetical protein